MRVRAADVRRVAVTMVAVLLALASGIALREAAGLTEQVPVLAVVLALTLSRVEHVGWQERLAAGAEVPVVALAAAGVGWLVFHEPWVGQPLLVVGLSVGILLRRWGPAARQAGRLVTLPFVALLVTPVAATPGGSSSILWAPLVALIALFWTMAVRAVADRWWPSPGAPAVTAVAAAPAAAPAPRSPATPGPTSPARRRLDAPTRMTLQMAAGLAAALIAGHLLLGGRWEWPVLSAFLVASGNRGRGDVVHKAGLRVIGGVLGTVGATLVAGWLPTDHRTTLLVVLFVTMAIALVLRNLSYAWWAAGVTAMVALLYAYFGEATATALDHRLIGVLVGSALGVAAAWLVVPVRSRDVFRRRVADCLAALTDDLADDADPSAPTFPSAVDRLDELVPTLRARTWVDRRAAATDSLHAVRALHELDPLPSDALERRRLRRDVVRVRRAMVGRDDPPADELPRPLVAVHTALRP